MSELDRLPPHSLEAEEAILGSLLIDPDAIYEVASFLRPEAFYRSKNRRVYEAIVSLSEGGNQLDLLTLADELRRREQLEGIGGEGFLISLINAVPTSVNARSYGRLVEAAALRRRMITAAGTIAELAYNEAENIDIVVDKAERALFSISEERTTRDLVPIKQIASDYYDRVQELQKLDGNDVIGVPTGYTDLDRLLGGLNKSDLLILAARPGMGKCVTADTRLINPHTGELIDIETLVKQKKANLLTLDENFKLTPSQAGDFVDNGMKPVYRVTTALGREIKATLSHPFLTVEGWKPLHELESGARIAVPRILPIFGNYDAPDHEAKTLAYLIADGSVVGKSPQFSNNDPRLREDFTRAALQFPGNKARVHDSNGTRTPSVYITQDKAYAGAEREGFSSQLKATMTESNMPITTLATDLQVAYGTVESWRSGRNFPSPTNFDNLCRALDVAETHFLLDGHAQASKVSNTLTVWLQQQAVWGKSAAEKGVPDIVFRYTRDKLALFLNRLFACDGSAYLQNGSQPVISYTTISDELAKSVTHLLLRFGIIVKLRRRQIKYKGSPRTVYQLRITDSPSLLLFADEIGIFGKEEAITAVRQRCLNTISNTNRDTIPVEIWEQITQIKGERSWADVHRKMGLSASHNLHVGKRSVGRARLLELAEALESESLGKLAQSDIYWDEIVAIESLGERQVYDLTVPVSHNFVADDMIVHNTSLQIGIALTAALKHSKRIAMFNLEMSGEQLVQRMIAAETKIDSQRLRRGQLHEHELPIFAEAIGRLSETRIFIDDTPSITPLQLHTKCRRLYAEHGLDLIMIDYLQLMQGSANHGGNRVMEISEISRSLKGLARELDVPVLAAAQLSRAVEQRQDKHPLLSDLRDSGCLTGDTLITMADSGSRVPMRELSGQSGFKVWALNEETMKMETAVVSRAFSTGVKPVFLLKTQLGREIKATANHKFRSFDDWKRLDEFQIGDYFALPRNISASQHQTMPDEELALLGHLIGDGCVLPRHSIQYTTRELDLAETVVELTQTIFPTEIKPRIQQERTWYQVYLASTRHHTHGVRNAVSDWFTDLGIFGLRSHEKFVPDAVFEQSEHGIEIFLRHLWATDGCINLREANGRFHPRIYYASSSKQLAQNVQSLLLRLEINARLSVVPQKEKGRDQYHVTVSGKEDMQQFADKIAAVGQYKKDALATIQDYLNGIESNTNRDVIPFTSWRQYVVPAMQQNHITTREMQKRIGQPYCGTALYKQNLSRERANRVANAVESSKLERLANSDIYWDKVVSIEPIGEEVTFDLTVPNLHNFIANDMVVHNSIEQDADIVMFIYRDEYYNAETTERPGIAEIQIAKHRNGPTGSIDLYWHAQLASFRNLSHQEIEL